MASAVDRVLSLPELLEQILAADPIIPSELYVFRRINHAFNNVINGFHHLRGKMGLRLITVAEAINQTPKGRLDFRKFFDKFSDLATYPIYAAPMNREGIVLLLLDIERFFKMNHSSSNHSHKMTRTAGSLCVPSWRGIKVCGSMEPKVVIVYAIAIPQDPSHRSMQRSVLQYSERIMQIRAEDTFGIVSDGLQRMKARRYRTHLAMTRDPHPAVLYMVLVAYLVCDIFNLLSELYLGLSLIVGVILRTKLPCWVSAVALLGVVLMRSLAKYKMHLMDVDRELHEWKWS